MTHAQKTASKRAYSASLMCLIFIDFDNNLSKMASKLGFARARPAVAYTDVREAVGAARNELSRHFA